MARLIAILLVIAALAAIGWRLGSDWVRRHPQDVPWTPLSLTDPIGRFTAPKLAALADSPAQCRALLEAAGAGAEPAPPLRVSADCGYADGIRVAPVDGGAAPSPPGLVTSCPVAASLVVFERQILQPAARRHLNSRVAAIEHAGSYSCRRVNNRADGPFSEHAAARALDVTGFTLADGRRVSVLDDWAGADAEAAFLAEVRDGACRLFATVLSPDYNAAHADHLHVDQAQRGRLGAGLCR